MMLSSLTITCQFQRRKQLDRDETLDMLESARDVRSLSISFRLSGPHIPNHVFSLGISLCNPKPTYCRVICIAPVGQADDEVLDWQAEIPQGVKSKLVCAARFFFLGGETLFGLVLKGNLCQDYVHWMMSASKF